MRALLFPWGTAGDVFPFAALARELALRGDEPRVFANERYAQFFSAPKVQFFPIGTRQAYAQAFSRVEFWRDPRGMMEYATGPELETSATAVAAHADESTVVVAAHFALGAVRGARAANVRVARLLMQPSVFDAPPMLWQGDRSLSLFPEWFSHPRAQGSTMGFWVDAPDRSTLPNDVADFLKRSPRPLVFASHPAGQNSVGDYMRLAAGVGKRLSLPVIVLSRGGTLDGAPEASHPANESELLVIRHAPFATLFQACSAVVHHGGIGTVAHALAANVPQFIIPLALDQMDQARRVVSLGVGKAAAAGENVIADTVSDAIASMLADESTMMCIRAYADRINAVRAQVMPRVCDALAF